MAINYAYLISEDTENCVLDALPNNFLQQFTLNESYQSLTTKDIEIIGQKIQVCAIVNSQYVDLRVNFLWIEFNCRL